MDLTIERVLTLFGPSLARLKLYELEIVELRSENTALRQTISELTTSKPEEAEK